MMCSLRDFARKKEALGFVTRSRGSSVRIANASPAHRKQGSVEVASVRHREGQEKGAQE